MKEVQEQYLTELKDYHIKDVVCDSLDSGVFYKAEDAEGERNTRRAYSFL